MTIKKVDCKNNILIKFCPLCGKKFTLKSTTREMSQGKCENCNEKLEEIIPEKILNEQLVKYCELCNLIIKLEAKYCPTCSSRLTEEIKEAKSYPKRSFKGINSLKYFGLGVILPGLLLIIPTFLRLVIIFPHFLIIAITITIRGIRIGNKERRYRLALIGMIVNSLGLVILIGSYIFLVMHRYF